MRFALRRTALLAAAAIAVPGLAACGSGQASHAGSAATVGSDRITTTQLSDRVVESLKEPTAKEQISKDRASFERRVLTLLIDDRLINQAAAKQGVTVTDGEVEAKLKEFATRAGGVAALAKQGAAAGIPQSALKGYVRDLVLADKLGDKLTASQTVPAATLRMAYRQNFLQVHATHILVKKKALADKLLAQVKADPKRFAALAKKYSTDTGSKAKGGDLGMQPAGQFVKPFADAVATAPVGSYTEVRTKFGYHVIHLLDRKATKTLAAAMPELRRQALQTARQAAITKLLSDLSKQLSIKVNPRFGTWDAAQGAVQPPKDTVTSPAPGSGSPSTGASPSPSPSASG